MSESYKMNWGVAQAAPVCYNISDLKHTFRRTEMKIKATVSGQFNTHRPSTGHKSLSGTVLRDRRLRRLSTRAAQRKAALSD